MTVKKYFIFNLKSACNQIEGGKVGMQYYYV